MQYWKYGKSESFLILIHNKVNGLKSLHLACGFTEFNSTLEIPLFSIALLSHPLVFGYKISACLTVYYGCLTLKMSNGINVYHTQSTYIMCILSFSQSF